MIFSNRNAKLRTSRPNFAGRKLAPTIEIMESRQLLTGGCSATGFLTGSVLLDGASGAPVSGATIELFKATNTSCPVSTQTTGCNGQYLFTGLQPGNYVLKEIAPKGYTANGATPHSQLDPAQAIGSDTINVTVVDPTKVFVNYGGIAPGSYSVVNDVVYGKAGVNSVGPQADSLGTAAGKTDLNSSFHTFCVNDQQSLSFSGGEQYQVAPKPISALTNGTSTVSADHAGRIAYLFNHYGNSSLSNVQGAGLQLAIWELLYDSGNTANFTSGNFQVPSQYLSVNGETLSQVLTQAQSYFNESAGKCETAVFLDASAYTCSTQGIQSVLCTESLDFSSRKTTTSGDCDQSHLPTGCNPTPIYCGPVNTCNSGDSDDNGYSGSSCNTGSSCGSWSNTTCNTGSSWGSWGSSSCNTGSLGGSTCNVGSISGIWSGLTCNTGSWGSTSCNTGSQSSSWGSSSCNTGSLCGSWGGSFSTSCHS